jgi:hypothetical protein
MRALLVHLHQVLTTDTDLVSLVPSENIGAIIRQDAGSPSLEYGIDGEEADHSGHRNLQLAFVVAAQAGAEITYEIKERLEALMTAKKLSTSTTAEPLTFTASQVRLTDSRVYPRTGWAHALRIEFDLRISDLRPRTQKQ